MGARVYPNAAREIGWLPIHSTGVGEGEHCFRFPSTCTVFYWHGETFDLPDACVNQAFQLGQRVVGLQSHLETTPLTAKAIVEYCRYELVSGEPIQAEAEILSAPSERHATVNALMASFLAYLTRLGSRPGTPARVSTWMEERNGGWLPSIPALVVRVDGVSGDCPLGSR